MSMDATTSQVFKPDYKALAWLAVLLAPLIASSAWSVSQIKAERERRIREWTYVRDCESVAEFAREYPSLNLVPGNVLSLCAPTLERQRENRESLVRQSVSRLLKNTPD